MYSTSETTGFDTACSVDGVFILYILSIKSCSYFNNFLAYGLANVVRDTAKGFSKSIYISSLIGVVGGNGFIVVDLPPEEGKELSDMAKDADLGFIPLVSPTTSVRRMKTIAELAHGFVYCVRFDAFLDTGNVDLK